MDKIAKEEDVKTKENTDTKSTKNDLSSKKGFNYQNCENANIAPNIIQINELKGFDV